MFSHRTVVFILLVCCSLSILAGSTCEPKHICDHDQNTIVFENCSVSSCSNCSKCHIGMGLMKECQTAILIGTSNKCVNCIDGKTYNDVDAERIVSCKSCNYEEHRKVISPCNRTHNTRYADECDAGYWFSLDSILGPCIKCFCCNNDKDQVERRCLEVGGNVPVNTSCICPVAGNVYSTQQSRTNNRTVTEGPPHTSTETAPTDPTNMSRSIMSSTIETTGSRSSTTPHVSNKELPMTIGLPAAIIALIIFGICVVVYCKKKNAPGGSRFVQSNSGGYQLTSVTSDDGNTEGDKPATPRGACMPPCIPQRDAQSSDSVNQLLSAKSRWQPNINNFQLPQVPDCRLSKLSFPLKRHLFMKLDMDKGPYKANWYDVGKAFNVPNDQLDSLELCYRSRESPTRNLFALLETRGEGEPFVKELLEVLQELQRTDIINSWDWEGNIQEKSRNN